MEIEALMPLAVGLLRTHRTHRTHRTRAIVFWCADGEDGFKTTYACFVGPSVDGASPVRLRQLGTGGLDYQTTPS